MEDFDEYILMHFGLCTKCAGYNYLFALNGVCEKCRDKLRKANPFWDYALEDDER